MIKKTRKIWVLNFSYNFSLYKLRNYELDVDYDLDVDFALFSAANHRR